MTQRIRAVYWFALLLATTVAVFHPIPATAQAPKTVRIVKRDASVIEITYHSVSVCGFAQSLDLGNGQSVDLENIKMLEPLTFQGKDVQSRLTLRNGKAVQFTLTCTNPPPTVNGSNDVGPVEVNLHQVAKIVFQ
jgi:hypothetical protein